MKCKNCGVEFLEGIFCPECGTRNERSDRISKKKDIEKVEYKLKTEGEKTEQERLENEKAKKENDQIDLLKIRLESTKSQLERQQIISGFDADIQTSEAIKRLEKLKAKVNQHIPAMEKNNKYVGIISFLLLGISFILICICVFQNDSTSIMTWIAFWGFLLGIIGIAIWFVRKILILIQSKTKNYYLYIKDI